MQRFILKWNEATGSETGESWFIRGVSEDGHYYGEVMYRAGDSTCTHRVEGDLTHLDATNFISLGMGKGGWEKVMGKGDSHEWHCRVAVGAQIGVGVTGVCFYDPAKLRMVLMNWPILG